MLNYETILSNYDDKLTLMQWLKKVEAVLENASATAFHVNKRGDASLTFSIDFEDGTSIESNEFVLQQGESVASARISNGHLILTLTNGDEIDAGNMFNGNVNVSGNITANNLPNGIGFDENNLYVLTKDGTPIAGSVPFSENANSTLKSYSFEFNGSASIDVPTAGFWRVRVDNLPNSIYTFTMPTRCRTQLTYDFDAAKSLIPDLNNYMGINFYQTSGGGTTAGDYIFKLKTFASVDNIYLNLGFGNYGQGIQPYFGHLCTPESQLPEGVSIYANDLNVASGGHRLWLYIRKTMPKPLLVHVHIENGIYYLYVEAERTHS